MGKSYEGPKKEETASKEISEPVNDQNGPAEPEPLLHEDENQEKKFKEIAPVADKK